MSIKIEEIPVDGTCAVVLLSREELRNIKGQADKKAANLPSCPVVCVKSLNFI